ncbi:MAG: glycoprotein [Bactrocera latifrons orthophasmavirus]|nr:MAG: glycoprotein [Bactrocera latifrons orthophasmavirus]
MKLRIFLIVTFIAICSGNQLHSYDGRIRSNTMDECTIWNNGGEYKIKPFAELPGLYYGLIKYQCGNVAGTIISKLKCKTCGIFCYENELIDGCQQGWFMFGAGALSSIFTMLIIWFIFRKYIKLAIYKISDSIVESMTRRKAKSNVKKVKKITKVLNNDHFKVQMADMLSKTHNDGHKNANTSQTTIELNDLSSCSNTNKAYNNDPEVIVHNNRARTPTEEKKPTMSLLEAITASTTAALLLSSPQPANACDNTLYLQSNGQICDRVSCYNMDAYEFNLQTGSTVCFNDDKNNVVSFKLLSIELVTKYSLMYYTQGFYIDTTSTWNCKGSGECWAGGCMPNSIHPSLFVNDTTEVSKYGCLSGVIGCDTMCYHQSSCTWYSARMRRVGLKSPVYQAIRKGWEAQITVSSGNTTTTSLLNVNRPSLLLKGLDGEHPIKIQSVLHEQVIDENGLVVIDGKAYKTHIAGLNMPQSDIIGDLQLGLKGTSHAYNTHNIDCRSESCSVQCEYPESKLIRMKRHINQFQEHKFTQSSSTGIAIVAERVIADVSVMVGNYRFNNLYVQNAMCDIDLITTYSCEACSTMPYAVFQSFNIKKEGTVPFESNCTFDVNHLSCNTEPFKLTLQNENKICRITLPSINKTKIMNFNYIYLGELDPTSSRIAQETTMDTISTIVNNNQFLTTLFSGITGITIVGLVTSISVRVISAIMIAREARRQAKKIDI